MSKIKQGVSTLGVKINEEMSLAKYRIKEIKDCVDSAVNEIRKIVELEFNKENYHKSGRSGGHGKKFNIIGATIVRKKNDNAFLLSTACFQNPQERDLVTKEFTKHAERFHNKAKSINHR